MTPRERRDLGVALVREVFGGLLTQQGRGFYVALELFAIAWGIRKSGRTLFEQPDEVELRYARRSHDFARRLLVEPDQLDEDEKKKFGRGAEKVLRALLEGLVVPMPGRKAATKFPACHFFPYVGDLVHHDAVWRRGKVKLERYTYRGGGALAYTLLRTDHDSARRQRVANGLAELVSPSEGPLGALASALAAHDRMADDPDGSLFHDDVADQSEPRDSPWIDIFRSGVDSIVTRDEVPRARRVDALVYWTPFCLAMHQVTVARAWLGEDPGAPLAFDCGGRKQIRRLAREHATHVASTIPRALEKAARGGGHADLLRGSQKWRQGPKTFFTTTLGMVGALNAMTGLRHFVLGPSLLEAITLALAPHDMTFDDFLESELHGRLRMVVDGRAAESANLLGRVDRGEFQINREALVQQMRDLGLLREFSDMTKIVTSRNV